MNSPNSFQLISSEQLISIETLLIQIKDIVSSHPKAAQPESDEEVLTTKEAMSFLKISHINTFKSYLKNNNITSLNNEGPQRFLKSDLIRKREN
jgi:hypothetical protein